LDKTIATFTFEQSSFAKQPSTPANSISTEQQSNKKRKATKPSLNTLEPQSLTLKKPLLNLARKTIKLNLPNLKKLVARSNSVDTEDIV
jgi:hypothetical protein